MDLFLAFVLVYLVVMVVYIPYCIATYSADAKKFDERLTSFNTEFEREEPVDAGPSVDLPDWNSFGLGPFRDDLRTQFTVEIASSFRLAESKFTTEPVTIRRFFVNDRYIEALKRISEPNLFLKARAESNSAHKECCTFAASALGFAAICFIDGDRSACLDWIRRSYQLMDNIVRDETLIDFLVTGTLVQTFQEALLPIIRRAKNDPDFLTELAASIPERNPVQELNRLVRGEMNWALQNYQNQDSSKPDLSFIRRGEIFVAVRLFGLIKGAEAVTRAFGSRTFDRHDARRKYGLDATGRDVLAAIASEPGSFFARWSPYVTLRGPLYNPRLVVFRILLAQAIQRSILKTACSALAKFNQRDQIRTEVDWYTGSPLTVRVLRDGFELRSDAAKSENNLLFKANRMVARFEWPDGALTINEQPLSL